MQWSAQPGFSTEFAREEHQHCRGMHHIAAGERGAEGDHLLTCSYSCFTHIYQVGIPAISQHSLDHHRTIFAGTLRSQLHRWTTDRQQGYSYNTAATTCPTGSRPGSPTIHSAARSRMHRRGTLSELQPGLLFSWLSTATCRAPQQSLFSMVPEACCSEAFCKCEIDLCCCWLRTC
jgi:hypothetical protein